MSTTFSHKNIQGYSEQLPTGELHVHLHGSNSSTDWLANLTAIFVPWRGAWVHWGWLQGALSMLNHPLWGDKSRPIVLTGFSYGGAVAQLLGYALKVRGYTIRVEVAASPKVGNKAWSKKANILDILRHEAKGDVVPTMPPWGVATGRVNNFVGTESGTLIHSPRNYKTQVNFSLFE